MIIGTAGHVDHGKSALVQALTGQAMDRLHEERRRGITIDLNFAPLRFDGLPVAGVVDVPGHEDFVRTMVAGASGIDLVLLVVDAAEGIMPQTIEHLAIVEQLAVPAGIPVLTKCDLADDEWLALIEAEVRQLTERSAIPFSSPVRVSALTGAGIAELRAQLGAVIGTPSRRQPADLFRLPVDRAFSLPGVGTVLTGTTWSGTLAVGDRIRLLPSGLEGRVRTLSSHHETVPHLGAAVRSAVGVSGIERIQVRRGDLLVRTDESWSVTRVVDAELRLAADAPRPISARTRLRVHLGTAELFARVQPRQPISPGEHGLARLTLEAPTVVRGGDRFVVRGYSPVLTIGGGTVLDPCPPRRAKWPKGLEHQEPGGRLPALLARRPDGVGNDRLAQLTGLPPAEAERLAQRTAGIRRIGDWWTDSGRLREVRERAIARLEAYHAQHPAESGLSLGTLRQGLTGPLWLIEAALVALQQRGDIEVSTGVVRRVGFHPTMPGGNSLLDRIVEAVATAGLTPPTTTELGGQLDSPDVDGAIRLLVGQGRVERVEPNRCFAPEALERFVEAVREVAEAQGEVTPAALRERLGLSRKYLIPLLEWADRTGLTRRDGDRRVLVRSR